MISKCCCRRLWDIQRAKACNGWPIFEMLRRAIKRVVRPMLGFKSFRSARTTLQGIELTHIINLSAAEQFYSLAA